MSGKFSLLSSDDNDVEHASLVDVNVSPGQNYHDNSPYHNNNNTTIDKTNHDTAADADDDDDMPDLVSSDNHIDIHANMSNDNDSHSIDIDEEAELQRLLLTLPMKMQEDIRKQVDALPDDMKQQMKGILCIYILITTLHQHISFRILCYNCYLAVAHLYITDLLFFFICFLVCTNVIYMCCLSPANSNSYHPKQ